MLPVLFILTLEDEAMSQLFGRRKSFLRIIVIVMLKVWIALLHYFTLEHVVNHASLCHIYL